MGGYVAQNCVKLFPEVFEGIILLNSTPFADSPEKCFDVARAATHDTNTVGFQLVFGTLAHISGQHHLDTHLLQIGSDARLTTAPLGRRQLLTGHNAVILDGKNRIVVTMTEVVIDTTITCRYSNFHRFIIFWPNSP